MFTFFCIVQEHAKNANKMQEVDQELQIERTLQLGDTDINNNTEVEGWTMAFQEFRGADHAPIEEDTEVANKVEKSKGPLKGMDEDPHI